MIQKPSGRLDRLCHARVSRALTYSRVAKSNPLDYSRHMQTVAETPEFARKIRKLVGDADYRALIAYLAEHPQAGDVMRGTGGIRKLRWARDGAGKSGGVRVIYYVHDERIPLYLLTVFGKNEKANISQAERNTLAQLVALLTKAAGV